MVKFIAPALVIAWLLLRCWRGPSSHEAPGLRTGQPLTRSTPVTDTRPDSPFGACPICGAPGVCLNIEREHWFVCHQHRTRWCVGRNLFSSWRSEDEAVWQRNHATIRHYREVERAPAEPA